MTQSSSSSSFYVQLAVFTEVGSLVINLCSHLACFSILADWCLVCALLIAILTSPCRKTEGVHFVIIIIFSVFSCARYTQCCTCDQSVNKCILMSQHTGIFPCLPAVHCCCCPYVTVSFATLAPTAFLGEWCGFLRLWYR
jgi:hypothetical protein